MFHSKPQSPQGNTQRTEESGVTLVVAVVMLAAVTFISFSISTVVIREIGAARAILRSEPAISGANSGGEVGLYRLIRETGGTSTQGSLQQSGATYQVQSQLYEDDPYRFSIVDGKKIQIGLYDPENSSKTTGNYQSVTVTNPDNNSFKVTVFSWSNTKTAVCPKQTLTKNGTYQCTLSSVDDRYIVEIEPNGQTAAGDVSAVKEDGSRGVPAASPGMDAIGTSGSVQRKIEIKLKTQ